MMEHTKAIVFPALLALAFLGGSAAVQAQETYMGLQIGYNMVADGDLDYSPAASTSYEYRPAFSGYYGYLSQSGFRVEGELGWRANDLDKIAGADVDGRLTTLSLMVNFLYEGEFGGGGYGLHSGIGVRPYVGIGGGGGLYSLDAVTVLGAPPAIDDQAYALAWQGIAGLGFEMGGDSVLTLDYRYLVADNVKLKDAGATPFEIDSIQSTLMLGMRTTF